MDHPMVITKEIFKDKTMDNPGNKPVDTPVEDTPIDTPADTSGAEQRTCLRKSVEKELRPSSEKGVRIDRARAVETT